MLSLVLAGIVAAAAPAEVLSTGEPLERSNHPLAALSFPSLAAERTQGGASASVGGFLNTAGAWAATPHGGVTFGFAEPTLQEHWQRSAMLDAGGDGSKLLPQNPVGAWATTPYGPWSWGASVRYGNEQGASKLAGAVFDRDRSESLTALLGGGRRFRPFRLDFSLGYDRLSAETVRGSLLDGGERHALSFRRVAEGAVRAEAGPAGSLVVTASAAGGDGARDGAPGRFAMWAGGFTWRPTPLDSRLMVKLGADYRGRGGLFVEHEGALQQSATYRLVTAHHLTVAAVESTAKLAKPALSRLIWLGYQYGDDTWAFTLAADVERFPKLIVTSVKISL